MFKYRGVNLIKSVYRPYSPLMTSLFWEGFGDQNSWRRFIGLNYSLRDSLMIAGIYYYPEYHLVGFAQKAVKHVFKDKRNFQHLRNETIRREKLILAKNNKKNLKSFLASYLNYQPTLALYHICDDFIESGLRKELLKKVSANEAEQLMASLNLPLKPNLDRQMKLWLLKTKDIEGFIKRYSWNFSRYGQHQPLSRSAAQKFLNDIKKDKSLLGEDKNRLATKKAIKRAKAVLGPKAYYVDVMQFFVYYRTHRTDILNKTFFSYYDKLVSFAQRLNLSYDDLNLCSYEELVSGLIPNEKVLAARRVEAGVVFSHGKLKIVSGQELKYFKNLCRDLQELKTINGRTAFPGIAKGKVKIIRSPKDFSSFKAGNILVSSMTTPSMVPIMKRAAAFVTDEGGITCHASILAREMKKPCVIGTKNATQVLHDGDQVEVDAKQGTVRIVKINK